MPYDVSMAQQGSTIELASDAGEKVAEQLNRILASKAFRQADGGVAAFRPDAHAERFRSSARRLALPELPEETFLEAIDLLLETDHEWVPSATEHSLYLRPLMFATEVSLSVHPSEEVTFLLIAYGVKPLSRACNRVKGPCWRRETAARRASGPFA